MTKLNTSIPLGNLICLKSIDGVPLFSRNFNNAQEVVKKFFFTNFIYF